MKKEKIRIDFADFWPYFIKTDNYFFNLLSTYYDVEVSPIKPDILFHSVDYSGKEQYRKYEDSNTKKIFYTGENTKPNFEISDGSFTFIKDSNEFNFRLPLWVLHINWFNKPYNKFRDQAYLIKEKNLLLDRRRYQMRKNKFCSFIATKPLGRRAIFVPKLNDIQKVHCAGKLFNNTKKVVKGRGDQKWKINYIKNFRFNISFENAIGDGYVTEKIIHPMAVDTIPIYWGSPEVKNDFNPKSFIYANQFDNDDELIDHILQIDKDKDLYNEIMNEPWFINNDFPEDIKPKNVLKFINKILNS